MEKRQIAFIVISILFLLVWNYFYVGKQTPETAKFVNTTSKQIFQKNNPLQDEQKSIISKTIDSPNISFTIKTIDTPQYYAVIAQENGFFKKLELKNYKKTLNSNKLVDIFRDGKIDCYDVVTINGITQRIVYSSTDIKDEDEKTIITFKASVGTLNVEKFLTLNKNSYDGDVVYQIKNNDLQNNVNVVISTVLIQPGTVFDSSVEENPVPAFFYNNTFDMPSERSLKKGYIRENVLYAGYEEKYFALFIIDPTKKIFSKAIYDGTKTELECKLMDGVIGQRSTLKLNYKYFAGPKETKILAKAHEKLAASIDYGWFHFIAKPLLMIMNFFNTYTHNYGISIILLTILIKLIFFPLSHKSYRSMKKMQEIQPKLEELRKKYANDKEALNREIMLLYRRYGVNPVSGCLPMLIQIPFFIALYQTLMHAIELRHAPFFGWIHDLSGPDPYYITPIVMGATMLIQQVLTPSSGDSTQKRMMYILPVVFTFMFLKFPSGLVIYWLINNVFSIIQQLYTLKTQRA